MSASTVWFANAEPVEFVCDCVFVFFAPRIEFIASLSYVVYFLQPLKSSVPEALHLCDIVFWLVIYLWFVLSTTFYHDSKFVVIFFVINYFVCLVSVIDNVDTLLIFSVVVHFCVVGYWLYNGTFSNPIDIHKVLGITNILFSVDLLSEYPKDKLILCVCCFIQLCLYLFLW